MKQLSEEEQFITIKPGAFKKDTLIRIIISWELGSCFYYKKESPMKETLDAGTLELVVDVGTCLPCTG